MFTDLGQFQLGDFLPLTLQTVTGDETTPTLPTAAPTAKIFNASGTLVETISLPIHDPVGAVAYFQHKRQLDSTYSAGKYFICYQWTTTSAGVQCQTFEILAGGDADGAVIGMAWFEVPEARNVVYQLDSGALRAGRNPR